jgi:predicted metal-dependent HD superfamily phosphohydrolase
MIPGNPERVESLQRNWIELMRDLGVSLTSAFPAFDDLVLAYSEPHRRYHTLDHLAEVFRVAGRLMRYAESPRTVKLAIWYHDAVYDPRKSDNESASVVLFRRHAEEIPLEPGLVEDVAELILLTRHQNSVVPGPKGQVLLDADLAILGSAPERYLRYTEQIRAEYDWVPEADYCRARITLLEQFLARPRIYHTEIMREMGEQAARTNMTDEISRLTSTR